MPLKTDAKIAGATLSVPIVKDQETTAAIVQTVNERLRQIEAQSAKINTQHFALLAAYSFASEVEELRQQANDHEREFLTELDVLLTKLKAILEDESPGEQ